MRRRSSHLALVAACAFLATASLQAKGAFFDSKGVRIHYLDEGEGDPVLLIHGFTASATLNWGIPGILKNLAADHRVIALDNRGHGSSDKPQKMEDYGAEMVEDAVRLLDHLEIESAHVVGYSMGGMIALKMSVPHPERMRSAVIGGMGWTRLDDETRQRYEGSTTQQTSPALTACYRRFWELGISEEQLSAVEGLPEADVEVAPGHVDLEPAAVRSRNVLAVLTDGSQVRVEQQQGTPAQVARNLAL